MPQVSHPARPVGPPVEELVSRYHIVMLARAVARVDTGKVRFERSVPYYGDAAACIVLRTGETDEPIIETGQVYLLGYTRVTSDSQFREVKYEDPEGPRIVSIRGVDNRAFFADTPELRFLFEQATADTPAPPRKVLDALLVQMQRGDENARILVALELMLRPDLIAIVDAEDGAVLQDVIADDSVPLETRDLLLQTAARVPEDATAGWLADMQRTIIRSAPVEMDLLSLTPAFVRTAAKGLKNSGDADDLPALRRLLASNAPGVAKAALETMDVLDPDATLAIAREARTDETLLAETRQTLSRYVNRRER